MTSANPWVRKTEAARLKRRKQDALWRRRPKASDKLVVAMARAGDWGTLMTQGEAAASAGIHQATASRALRGPLRERGLVDDTGRRYSHRYYYLTV